MAEVYKNVGGRKLTKIIALHADVQDALERETIGIALKAEADLAGHRDAGHARIETDHDSGKVDHYVVLSDERGQKAAMSIEYGRKPDEEGRGGMEGLFILHKAAGLRGGD